MSTILIILIMAVAVSILAKSGAITPYVAGGLAIAYGTVNQLDYNALLCLTITFYLIAYFSNSWAETQGRSMTTMLNNNAGSPSYGLLLIKVSVLILMMLAPIPKPPFYLQGLLAIIIATFLYQPRGYELWAIFLQTITFMALGATFNFFSTYQSYSLALIAAVVVPKLLHPDRTRPTIYDNDVSVSLTRLALSFFLTYITPGFSSNVITKSLFLPGVSQAIASATLEAAIEGWAIHIIFTNQITTKSVLGKLLSLPELEWSTFTPYISLKLVILCLPILAALITLLTPALNTTLPVVVPCAILALQATMTTGLIWTAIFIGAGYLISRLDKSHNKSFTPLVFMTQL